MWVICFRVSRVGSILPELEIPSPWFHERLEVSESSEIERRFKILRVPTDEMYDTGGLRTQLV
jgi:hypothetical protein